MADLQPVSLTSLPDFEPFPGYRGKLIHAKSMTVVHWTIDKDHEVPDHAHPHEQIINVMQGEFELNLSGRRVVMKAGDVLVIPGNVRHSGRSLTDCRIMDIWHPCREDYQVEQPETNNHE